MVGAGGGARIGRETGAEGAAPGFCTVIVATRAAEISEAGISPHSSLSRMKVVITGLPFHWMVEVSEKWLPLTVSLKSGPPAYTDRGLRRLMAGIGGGAEIWKETGPDTPPSALGLLTVSTAVLAVAISTSEMEACSWVPETKVVSLAAPFHWTMESAKKWLPPKVSWKDGPPAWMVCGSRVARMGVGGKGSMTRDAEDEMPPSAPGFNTVIRAVPEVAASWAGMEAWSWEAETKKVALGLPFHWMTESVK